MSEENEILTATEMIARQREAEEVAAFNRFAAMTRAVLQEMIDRTATEAAEPYKGPRVADFNPNSQTPIRTGSGVSPARSTEAFEYVLTGGPSPSAAEAEDTHEDWRHLNSGTN